MKKISFFYLLFIIVFCADLSAQNFSDYSVKNTHSHNDYLQKFPFWSAFYAGFGSIEADVFLRDKTLMVAHTKEEISTKNTLESLYIQPLSQIIKSKGKLYDDTKKSLILMIDIKEDYKTVLPELINLLKKYPEIEQSNQVKVMITGSRPKPSEFANYPKIISFDGEFNENYTPQQLERIAMFSGNLKDFTKWGGKGIPRDEDSEKIRNQVNKIHQLGKPIRFWNTPDFINAWVNLIDLKVDYINTDQIHDLANFMNDLPKRFFKNDKFHTAYQPTYKSDQNQKQVKNVILLIPDGVTLPQYYAAFTANKGQLNIFKMKSTGLSNTNSYNAYITDSAPGSNAFATGIKTKNNFVGVDAHNDYLVQIPEIIAKKKMVSGLITTGDITDATPADFYAHSNDRDDSEKAISDFIDSNVKYLIGGKTDGITAKNQEKLKEKNILWSQNLKDVNLSNQRHIITDGLANKNIADGRGNWLSEAFDKTITELNKNKDGFFLMVEASRTDINAHAKDFPKMVQELLDFDEVVGKALKFADDNGETLVVVVGDHETGALTLVDGNIKEGWVLGNYVSNDHTAIPASLFAYGPRSSQFIGFYENTEVFHKILNAWGLKFDPVLKK